MWEKGLTPIIWNENFQMGKRKKTQEKWEMTKIDHSKGNKSKWPKKYMKYAQIHWL